MIENAAEPRPHAPSEQTPPKPPMPKVLYRIVNPVLALLLRSPLHGVISHSLMLLSFRGRKTGKRFIIPVGYLQRNDHLFVFSHAAWAKNFRGGAPARVRLRGEVRTGTGTVIEDAAAIGEVVRLMTERHGEQMVQRMGLSADEGARYQGTTFIDIALDPHP
jgi:hypothetical protein